MVDLTLNLSPFELGFVGILYIFLVVMRYWKNSPVFEIVAIIPLIVMLLHFQNTYILALGFVAMLFVHIVHIWLDFRKTGD